MSSFKESLLHAKSSKLPKCVQDLVDVGLIQECETIDDIHYISFAFQLNNTEFYNYKNNTDLDDFFEIAWIDVMYVGGFAVNNNGEILKGIIYPYYYNFKTERDCKMFGIDNKLIPHIKGIPQIINKKDNLKLKDFFISNEFFRAYNLSTNFSDTWVKFILNKESYTSTYILCDEKGKLFEPSDYNDFTFYGHVKSEGDFQYKYTKKYPGKHITRSNAITISFIEKKLEDNTISSSIATRIFCTNEASKSRVESAEIAKEGMKFMGKSTHAAGMNIRTGLSNVANAINRPGLVVDYF